MSYGEQREAMNSANVKDRMTLAAMSEANKEILYYMAEHDPDEKVRAAVLENPATPLQASTILATDPSIDVRIALAARLVELLPDVSQDKQSQLYAFVVQALGTLALDEVLKIRKALSATLKDHAYTPPQIAGKLARDVEREVSEPILRFCVALSDEDLLDILRSHPDSWVIEAVASREKISEIVSGAVIESRDARGGGALIRNDGAPLSEGLLLKIVNMARGLPEWQKPIALRKSLPVSVATELASYVDASIRDILLARTDLDKETSDEVATVFRRRVEFADDVEKEVPFDKLKRLIADDGLNDESVLDALALREFEFVEMALGQLSGVFLADVKRVMAMKAAKPIVALNWKAGLSMRTALELQKTIGEVPHKEIIYPKGGTDYPIDEDGLNWQLEFLGL